MRIKKNTLITGTIILTVTGLASRLIGFFYRIFLSRLFGEENMGIYQLIGPVMALVFSLSAAGCRTPFPSSWQVKQLPMIIKHLCAFC